MQNTFLSQKDLARRWRLSPRTLERWRWIGTGPRFMKLGSRVIYRMDEIEAFEAQRVHESTSQKTDVVTDGGQTS